LLHAGIAPGFVSRLERELHDHFEDLQLEALRQGRNPAGASREARARLGRDSDIFDSFLARPELLSWVYRSRLVYGVLSWIVAAWFAFQIAKRAAVTSTIARYGFASVAASIVTLCLLFTLQLTISLGSLPVLTDAQSRATVRTLAVVVPPSIDQTPTHGPTQPIAEPGQQNGTRWVNRPSGPRPAPISAEGALLADLIQPVFEMPPAPPIVRPGFGIADGDMLPIVKVSPIYPPRAAARGLEGYVVIEYTVSRSGTVRDIVVIESSSSLFEQSALEAATRFKYKPRIVGGEAVAVSGVRTIIRFKLEA
jgi:protein TonB